MLPTKFTAAIGIENAWPRGATPLQTIGERLFGEIDPVAINTVGVLYQNYHDVLDRDVRVIEVGIQVVGTIADGQRYSPDAELAELTAACHFAATLSVIEPVPKARREERTGWKTVLFQEFDRVISIVGYPRDFRVRRPSGEVDDQVISGQVLQA